MTLSSPPPPPPRKLLCLFIAKYFINIKHGRGCSSLAPAHIITSVTQQYLSYQYWQTAGGHHLFIKKLCINGHSLWHDDVWLCVRPTCVHYYYHYREISIQLILNTMYIGMCLNLDSTTFAVFAIKKAKLIKIFMEKFMRLVVAVLLLGFIIKSKEELIIRNFGK